MFKHVSKQRKLAAKSQEAVFSDEDSSASEAEPSLASNSDSDNSDSASDEDDDGSDDEEELDTPEEEEEEMLLMPPPGYPSVEEALTNPIALPKVLDAEGEVVEQEGEGPVPVCVVCPNKALKHGKMTEVHLASKDHLRRHARFVAHVQTSELFNKEFLDRDAESLSAQIDKLVLIRATAPAAPTASTSAVAEDAAPVEDESVKLSSAQINAALKRKAAEEGRSRREVMREAKKAKNLVKQNARNEKRERLKARAKKAPAAAVAEGAEAAAAAPAEGEENKKKRKAKKEWGVKPTDEQIAARQAAKIAKREAEAAAKGLPPPEAPIHPTPKTIWPDQLEAIKAAEEKEKQAKVSPSKGEAGNKRKRPRKDKAAQKA